MGACWSAYGSGIFPSCGPFPSCGDGGGGIFPSCGLPSCGGGDGILPSCGPLPSCGGGGGILPSCGFPASCGGEGIFPGSFGFPASCGARGILFSFITQHTSFLFPDSSRIHRRLSSQPVPQRSVASSAFHRKIPFSLLPRLLLLLGIRDNWFSGARLKIYET